MTPSNLNKVRFLEALDSKLHCLGSMVAHLADVQVLSEFQARRIATLTTPQQINEVVVALNSVEGRNTLVDWEWTILPKERMSLTIVAGNQVKLYEWIV